MFTGSTICAHAYCHILHFGLPVRVGGLVVQQGELLHGDANGVTSIPIDIADEAADVAQEFCDVEKIVIGYVRGPARKPCRVSPPLATSSPTRWPSSTAACGDERAKASEVPSISEALSARLDVRVYSLGGRIFPRLTPGESGMNETPFLRRCVTVLICGLAVLTAARQAARADEPIREHGPYEPADTSPLEGGENVFRGSKVSVSDHWSDRVGELAVDGRHDAAGEHWVRRRRLAP